MILSLLTLSFPAGSAQTPADLNLRIVADKSNIPVGKSVAVTAWAKRAGQPVAGQELWAYVNGKQWGAQAITDATGKAAFILPLPHPGDTDIRVAPIPAGFQWPTKTFGQTADFTVGTPLPPGSITSNALKITVTPSPVHPDV